MNNNIYYIKLIENESKKYILIYIFNKESKKLYSSKIYTHLLESRGLKFDQVYHIIVDGFNTKYFSEEIENNILIKIMYKICENEDSINIILPEVFDGKIYDIQKMFNNLNI